MRSSPRFMPVLCAALLLAPWPARAQSGAPETAREGGQPLPAASLLTAAAAAQNPFLGGVPSGSPVPGTLELSLEDAIARGLEHNLGVVLSKERAQSADGARWMARSPLLPNVSAHVAESRQKINLEAYGFPVAPGESPLIGPFDVSDRRVSLSQKIFDYSAIETARAGSAAREAAQYAYQDARGNVVLVVANLYLQVLAAKARITSARAQFDTADVLYQRAITLKQAGMVSGVEVLRAQVQMQSQQQRVIFFENEFAKDKLGLARAIGLPLSQEFDLADIVPYQPLESVSLDAALQQAYASRADYKGALGLIKGAEAQRQAVYGEALPSVGLTADYGDIGNTWSSALGTYSVAASVRIPIFQGGRVRGRLIQADAALAGQRAQLADLRARIEYEVRTALLDVTSSDERVRVARSAADLAQQQLTQAEDRFTAGVASHIEVVQAQEAVATASENLISSLFTHNLAKAALARALGVAEQSAGHLLGGPTR